jgi:hypothetical protein
MKMKSKIKYDRFDSRLFFILACFFTAWALTDILLVFFDRVIQNAPPALLMLTVGTFPFTPILALLCWAVYIDIRVYFARLKKYGYSIPEKKKDHASIDELIASDVMQPQKQNARSTGSLVTAAVAALAGIGQIGYIIHILLRFTADPYSDLSEIILMSVIAFIPVLVFLFMSYIYFRESDNSKYRDDVERGGLPNRVPRVDFMKALGIILLVIIITFVADEIIINMLKYISRSREM